jgi:elongation factor Ts
MNSETDFVARNNDFQTFTQRVAQGALLSLPSVSSSILSSTALTNTEAETVGSTTLSATVLTGGDILTNKDCTVKDGVIGLSAKVGENIILRRGIKYTNSNGILSTYIHNSINSHAGAIGVIVSLIPSASTSSSPPLTKSHPSFPALQDLGKKVAMHIAAAKPSYLNKETIPSLEMEKEKNLAKEQMVTQIKNKPDHIVNKILEGKLNKWYSEICLQEQTYALSEDTIKISKFVETTSKAAGYPVIVNGYVCFRVGETAPPATTAN